MHRLLVALLAALDAVIAAAVGVAAALAPLTLLWVFGLGTPVWGALWPASASVWQFGHLVPITVRLPAEYLAAAGIPAAAATFVLSLAPLAFACFTAWFAARSGRRAALAGAWGTGVLSGGVVFAVAAAGIWFTARNGIAGVHGWQAMLFPVLIFVVPALVGALVTAWIEGDGGVVDRVRDRVDGLPGAWRELPALAVRGTAIVFVGLAGLGALVLLVALVARGGEIIALYEAGHMTAIAVIVVSLAQLAYLPTLVAWGTAFVCGPGFAVGAGTAVSPAGTQLGVVPGIPVLGALPASTSPWMLAVVVLPIAVGAFAGWALRSRLVTAAERETVGAQLALAVAVALLSAVGAALLAVLASGSIGPDRLTRTGPEPGPMALAVGVEVLVGAGILLLSPRRAGDIVEIDADAPSRPAAVDALPVWPPADRARADRDEPFVPAARAGDTAQDEVETTPVDAGFLAGFRDEESAHRDAAPSADETETAPIDPGFLGGPAEPDADRRDGRPPVD
jgi:hypothetical protein